MNIFANVVSCCLLAAEVEQAVSEMQRDGGCILSITAAVSRNRDGMFADILSFVHRPAHNRADQTCLEQKLFYVCCSCGTIFQ